MGSEVSPTLGPSLSDVLLLGGVRVEVVSGRPFILQIVLEGGPERQPLKGIPGDGKWPSIHKIENAKNCMEKGA